MTILFDLLSSQPVGNTKFHGGGEYIKTVFKTLVERFSNQKNIIVYYNFESFLDDWVKELISRNNIKAINVKNINEVEKVFIDENIDVFYSGLPYEYFIINIPPNVRKIGTFHGIRRAEKPSDIYVPKYTGTDKGKRSDEEYRSGYIIHYQKAFGAFDDIITDSYHSKYSIKAYFNLNEKEITVFYPPQKHVENRNNTNKNRLTENNKYILILGGDRWEKNVYRAILALENLYSNNNLEHRTIIIGKLPPMVKEAIKHDEYYQLYDYVETEFLEELYEKCDFFLYPSLNEGFGYPPLEAMHYGKTCIVSGVCSLPEVCGGGVYYFNPYDIKELEARILQAVEIKIEPAFIKQCCEKTNIRQQEDLIKICDFIAGEKTK
jgi:glycosyltransferase involved in cell wall biosynthesis